MLDADRYDRYDRVVPDGAPAGAVVLHPHPAYGGDRFNVVVDACFERAVATGVAVVRFDFSSADLGVGAEETRTAMAMLPPAVPVLLVGYSFGAVVASSVDDATIAGWALLAPPFGRMLPAERVAIARDDRPKLVLAPEHDQFCRPDAARQQTAGWQSVTVEPVASTDHGMAGATGAVASRAMEFLTQVVGGARGGTGER